MSITKTNKWFYWQFAGGRWMGVISYGDRPDVKNGYSQSGGGMKFPATDPVNVANEPYATMSLNSLKALYPNSRENEE